MSACPKDLQPCCDDLCRAGGCLRLQGAPMVERCDVCGEYSGDYILCRCDEAEAIDGRDWANE